MKQNKSAWNKRAVKLHAKGLNPSQVHRKLGEEGFVSTSGKQINRGSVYSFLKMDKPTRRYQKKPKMLEIVEVQPSSGKVVALIGNTEEIMKAVGFL